MLKYAFAAAAAAGLTIAAAPAAEADVLASGQRPGQCIDMQGGTQAILWQCHGASNQQFSWRSGSYGEILVGGRCLTAPNQQGAQLTAQSCNGSRGQKWVITGQAQLRNEDGWCADAERGGGQGARIITWSCGSGYNQKWGQAQWISSVVAASRGLVRPQDQANLARSGGMRISTAGVVSAGSANVVAAGGANVVAAGSANVVAPGGANIMIPVAGVVAAGGMN